MTDIAEIAEFMQRFSFATIITAEDNYPVATHLPFVVTFKNDTITLTSHFARANEQWKAIQDNQALVIFSEPHAYISPKHYEKELNVPTWNYIAVHAYGQATLVTEQNKVLSILENTIDYYEQSYRQQWSNLPEDYKVRMMKGIVAFEIVVTDIQAKKKLSQNKTVDEQTKIIQALSASRDSNERLTGEYMKMNLEK